MIRSMTLMLTLGLGLAMAQDQEYVGWMKAAGGSMGPLKKALDAKSGKEAADGSWKIK